MAFHFRRNGIRWLLIVATGAAVVTGSTALAAAITSGSPLEHGSQAHNDTVVAQSTISRQQAIDTALEAVPDATVTSAELDDDHGRSVWEVDLTTPDRVEHDVALEAHTGAILTNTIDDN